MNTDRLVDIFAPQKALIEEAYRINDKRNGKLAFAVGFTVGAVAAYKIVGHILQK